MERGAAITRRQAGFPGTRWTLVAQSRRDDPEAEAALGELCQQYWYPVYAFVRRSGQGAHDAEDLTQGFFQFVIAKDYFAKAEPEKGRLRSFLLIALKRFLKDDARKWLAAKRGAGDQRIVLDGELADGVYAEESAEMLSPEASFDRRWARSLLENVFARLRSEFEAKGKLAIYEALKQRVVGTASEEPQDALADQLGLPVARLRLELFRMRRRYGELLREEVADTVNDPQEVEGELRYLLSLFVS